MTPPVRIGVLGCAEIARRRLLPAMQASPEVTLVAVASRRASTASQLAWRYGARPVVGYRALVASDDVDALYVPLPTALHGPWIEAALRAGKHVLAEKPVTADAGETAALLEAAAARSLVLMENVMFPFHSQHRVVRGLLAAGAIGPLSEMRATFTVPPRPEGDIRYQPALGGGALLDTGVYPLRAAVELLGADLDVEHATLSAGPGRLVDTAGRAVLRRPDGVVAHAEFGLEGPYRSRYELCGREGRIVLEHAFTPPVDHRPVVALTRGTITESFELAPDDQVANVLRAFADRVRGLRAEHEQHDTATTALARLLGAVRDAAEVRRHAASA